MGDVTTIGLDLAKRVFQMHGTDASGTAVLVRKLHRDQVAPFFSKLAPCRVGLEACSTAHHWARTLRTSGHDVRLISPADAKTYVRRNKTDPADAAAICEAVSRPCVPNVPIKTAQQQAEAALHRLREQLIGQRTQLANMIRSNIAEYGTIAGKGIAQVAVLLERLRAEPCRVSQVLREALLKLTSVLDALDTRIAELDRTILAQHRQSEQSRNLATIPGIGPLIASALATRVIAPDRFKSGRDLAAWIGLVPRQNASGGATRLGRISKQGDEYLRRLLVGGAQSVLLSKRAKTDPWLVRLLSTKPRLVAAVAVANKLARIAWAVMTRGTPYRAPAAAA